jgi:hypothetical protein
MGNRIPLARLLAESVVVVLSILIAFTIDAGWDRAQAAALEEELLVSLERGFEDNVRLSQVVVQEAQRQQALIGKFVGMSPAEAELMSPDSTFLLLRALWRPNYVRQSAAERQYGGGLNNAALLATLEAGRLSLLSDGQLLTALAEWQGVAEDLTQRGDEVIEAERQVLERLARYPELQPFLAGFDRDGELPFYGGSNPPQMSGSVVRRAREDDELMGRAVRKGFLSRVQQGFLEDLEARADSVLTLVRANLRR